MNLDYWNKYYEDAPVGKPSMFARFCLQYMSKPGSLIDLGCGIGQDSLFFAEKGFVVTGIDQSRPAINICRKHKHKSLSFKNLSFSRLNGLSADYMYLRFILCAISEEEQRELFQWIKTSTKQGGKIFIECRSAHDTKVLCDNHRRRFLDRLLLEKQIKCLGFKILYSKEKRNFSPYHGENPLLIRIVGVKE